MPLLDVKNLTVRFGGLTAVKNLDLAVHDGQIVSMIGPNGAGKTTAFNAITGVYAPTEGQIRVEGRELIRPLSWPVRIACILVGLVTGLAGLLLAVNADLLWRATIRKNMRVENDPFTWGEVGRDLLSYLRGELVVEPGMRGQWRVVSPHLKREMGSAANRADAEELAIVLERTVELDEAADALAYNPRWRVTMDAERLADLKAAKRYVRYAVFWGFAIGFVTGVGGAYAVWRRSRRTPEVVARGGLARTFQNIRLFREMTVLENVLIGMDGAAVSGPAAGHGAEPTSWWRPIARSHALAKKAHKVLRFVGLDPKANILAGSLAYGDQRRLEIARALATRPKLLLLDEPAAGANPSEAAQLIELIRRIRASGVTVLLIEHHMNVVMEISDRVAVLNHGSKIAEGTSAQVRSDPAVIEAYLGKSN